MAKGGGSHGRRRDAGARRPAKPGSKPAQKPTRKPSPASAGKTPATRASAAPAGIPQQLSAEPRRLRLGIIPGATPGRWIDAWRERLPDVPIDVVPLELAAQRDSLTGGEVDLALVRLPLEPGDLSVIPLYDEIAVVLCSVDSALTAADELGPADLEGEVLIVPGDAVFELDLPGTLPPRFTPPAESAEAVTTVAAGVGIMIVPLSVARLHARRDVASRPLRGAPTSTVALAWLTEKTTSDVEAFIGIVRGRTTNSSR